MDTSSLSNNIFRFLSLVLCTICMFNFVTCSLKVQCNEKDMNTLLHFKQGVTDPSGFLSSWVTNKDCCEWKGVKCNNITGRVIELNLPCHTTHPTVVPFGEMDDKSHCLTGEINMSFLELEFLTFLNLSNNDFKTIDSKGSLKCADLSRGTISEGIGNLKPLESIDLSRNHFYGEIPQSMSDLHFVGVLNLSFNNFMGKIPSGTQVGSTNLSYIGNPGLCGPPLTKICPQDEKPHSTKPMEADDGDDKSQLLSCFYMGLGIGFAVGFLGVLGAIFFNRTCRHAYFKFLHRLYVMFIRKWSFFY